MTDMQAQIKEPLKTEILNMAKKDRIPHAIIIEGNSDVYIALVADFIIKSAMCTSSNPPCNICNTCVKIEKGIHPDIYTLKGSTAQGNVSVDDVRRMCSDMYVVPNEAKLKVYIIPNADKLNVYSQNALLKNIEEPVQNTLFVFECRNSFKLLETIRSRCTIIRAYSDTGEKDNESYYENMKLAKTLAESICSNSEYSFLVCTETLPKERKKLTEILHLFYGMITYSCIYSVSGRKENDNFIIQSLTNYISEEKLLKMSEIIIKAERALLGNANVNLTLTWMCSKLRSVKIGIR